MAAIGVSPMRVPLAEQGKGMDGGRANKIRAMADSWIATINVTGFPPFKALMTFTKDGALMVSQAAVVPWPTPNGCAIFTAGHGEWDRVKDGEFSITFLALIHDKEAEFLGTAKVTGRIEVNEPRAVFSGTMSATDLDPDGKVIFSFEASIGAERIRLGS